MGRLIDADAFEKFINEKYKDGESTDDIKDQMLFDLSYQPTAYNKKSVMAEIEDYSRKVYGEISVLKVLSIVRKGGVE